MIEMPDNLKKIEEYRIRSWCDGRGALEPLKDMPVAGALLVGEVASIPVVRRRNNEMQEVWL